MHNDEERIEELDIALKSSEKECYEKKCKITKLTRTIEDLEIDIEEKQEKITS